MLNKGALVFPLGALMMFLLLQMKALALTCLRWGSLWWHHLWHLAQGRLQVILFTKRSNNISRSITSSSGFFTSASSINLTPDETGLSLPTTCHENLYQDLKILRISNDIFLKMGQLVTDCKGAVRSKVSGIASLTFFRAISSNSLSSRSSFSCSSWDDFNVFIL